MQLSLPRLRILLALFLPSLVACGDAPTRVSRAELAAERSTSLRGGGRDPVARDSPSEGLPSSGSALAGVVEFGGPLADLERGTIFLVGREASTGSMPLVRRYEMADLVRSGPGEASLSFSLDQMHPTHTGEISQIELEVRIDLDGSVDSKEDVLASVRIPVHLGDQDVRVRVDDGARTAVPLPE